jgi:DNA-binding transcriptional LysR family regulator
MANRRQIDVGGFGFIPDVFARSRLNHARAVRDDQRHLERLRLECAARDFVVGRFSAGFFVAHLRDDDDVSPANKQGWLGAEMARPPASACGPPFLLLKEGHCFRENALSACRRSRVSPNVVFESGQFSTIVSMVATGMGVSVVPAIAVERRPGRKFVRISDERAARIVGSAQLKHRFKTRAQCALTDQLRRYPQTRLIGLD